MKIKTATLTAKTIQELAKKIETYQNNINYESKGSLPFSNLYNENTKSETDVGVIMFFSGDKEAGDKEVGGNSQSPTKKPSQKMLKILYKNNVDFDAKTITYDEASKKIGELPYFKNKKNHTQHS